MVRDRPRSPNFEKCDSVIFCTGDSPADTSAAVIRKLPLKREVRKATLCVNMFGEQVARKCPVTYTPDIVSALEDDMMEVDVDPTLESPKSTDRQGDGGRDDMSMFSHTEPGGDEDEDRRAAYATPSLTAGQRIPSKHLVPLSASSSPTPTPSTAVVTSLLESNLLYGPPPTSFPLGTSQASEATRVALSEFYNRETSFNVRNHVSQRSRIAHEPSALGSDWPHCSAAPRDVQSWLRDANIQHLHTKIRLLAEPRAVEQKANRKFKVFLKISKVLV
ncbi:hypothetical protein K469DRAFT_788350 [Zopfia rhizophila CBS 207.26]|uniref:Uncharacterized protein n=1 Tax=Zopfia rhizophila CBS 207.26 TaxID=1314779 RepID=A0A6A6DU94_9PEZI|nr:hypothetical protein K469DRAFT_788350 [Zopfia rhizophila CBS 207.26]